MKILFDHQAFSNQAVGGVSRYVFELISRLAVNCDVKLSGLFFQNRYVKELDRNNYDALTFDSRSAAVVKASKQINSLHTRYLKATQSFDIVHETFYFGGTVKGRTTVVTCYDLIHELFPSYFKDSAATIRAKRKIFNRADHIIAISQQTKTDLQSFYGIDSSKVSVIYLGADLKLEKVQPDLGRESVTPYFIYVGKRRGYKNWTVLIEALAKLKGMGVRVKLWCLGGGRFEKGEIDLISRLSLDGFCMQHDPSDSELGSFYANAVALVCTSLYEGFGLPILEAMKSGCPVISTTGGSLLEVTNGCTMSFSPNDVESLSEHMARLLDDGEFRKELIERGKVNASRFSWVACADDTLAVYRRLCT